MARRQRATALVTGLCLLLGIFTIPAAPAARLVCRFTGRPMTPVVVAKRASAAAREVVRPHSCCAVTPTVAASNRMDGAGLRAGWTLSRPSCCKLISSPERPAPPATVSPAAPLIALAWAPAPPRFFASSLEATLPAVPARRLRLPRAPPPRASAPRAPPVFS